MTVWSVVAQSLGGFTAAELAAARKVRALVFVNAMVPKAGETAGEWWDNVGQEAVVREAAEHGGYSTDFDIETYFLHDVDPAAAEGEPFQRDETDTVFAARSAVKSGIDVPIRVVAGRDDRFFPLALQRRVVHDRLGIEADVLPGGHLMVLSHPEELTAYLLAGWGHGPVGPGELVGVPEGMGFRSSPTRAANARSSR